MFLDVRRPFSTFIFISITDHMNADLELVNSTYWDTNSHVPPKEKLQQASDRGSGMQSTSTKVLSTTRPTKKPGNVDDCVICNII